MKGGYQILNLSTVTVGKKTEVVGVYEQVKGNNGKPVMVLTPDNQRVFAEVVESSDNYTLAYLGGDGSTYTTLIEDDNNVTITKQENDATIATKVAALETAVGDVNELTTTSKEVVGAINEVNSKDAEDIDYDNTDSGLTASDVQDAIDEINSNLGDVNTASAVTGNDAFTKIKNINSKFSSIPTYETKYINDQAYAQELTGLTANHVGFLLCILNNGSAHITGGTIDANGKLAVNALSSSPFKGGSYPVIIF